ncbi:hypothetical protein [Sphingomonas immobilis]|uniref:Uncharacterized protein n=1 Tax=Sphingomonas immobilis TaxID=3063997 RepID=A0ABT9A189_9SPHN|nr:hypothetical protein [Sphingomonas sp. CA1-15]MDO7843580.1 hypothetical protein [Sphingomonas sp. CA1-15]
MSITRTETSDFLLRRAEQEAVLAIQTGHPDAEAAHFEMALRYGERARTALAGQAAISADIEPCAQEPQRA